MPLAREATAVRASLSSERVSALAAKHGTPLYVYDLEALRERYVELRSAFEPAHASIYFATMANDQRPVLRTLSGLGAGACVNSLPHLALALECGFMPQKVQFSSTGVMRRDLQALKDLQIATNLDSLAQLEAWFACGANKGSLRVNAASLGAGLTRDRIGVDIAEVRRAVELAGSRGRALVGLHIYVGTNYQKPELMTPTLEAFFELATEVPALEYVNIGGGIGVDYEHLGPGFDLGKFGSDVARLARRLGEAHGQAVAVVVEPGRGLVAGCGVFVTSVTDVKELGGRRFVAVDGSVSVFPRPYHNPETPHRIRQVCKGASDASETVHATVVGRTTFSKDILGGALLAREIRTGDLLAFEDAGAYSQSMMSRFLGQPEPIALFVEDGVSNS